MIKAGFSCLGVIEKAVVPETAQTQGAASPEKDRWSELIVDHNASPPLWKQKVGRQGVGFRCLWKRVVTAINPAAVMSHQFPTTKQGGEGAIAYAGFPKPKTIALDLSIAMSQCR